MSFAFEQSTFSMTAECLPCCASEPPPAECECALLIPPFGSPYADYATAEDVIDGSDTTETVFGGGCVGYCVAGGLSTIDAFAASFDGTTLQIDFSSLDSRELDGWASITVEAGAVISVAYTTAIDEFVGAALFDCDGGTVERITGSTEGSGTIVFSAIVAAGVYYLKVEPSSADPLSCDITTDTTCSSDFVVNPVIAQWDDSGTTRKLWACPKLLLPPLTESTGTWYADATAAATAITNLTSNCDGYIESTTNVATFTATDGGTSLTLANTLTAGAMTSPRMWGGINAVNAATITVTGTVGAGTVNVNVNVYDDTGTLVEASGAVASPWTSAALPYKGRYTVSVAVTSSANTTSMSAAITSSGTISVNPVQARYDVTLTCAATDDC